MVEIVDGVLQLLEEALLIVTLRGDVGDLPDIERVAAGIRARQQTGLQAVPVGAGAVTAAGRQRLQQAEFFVALLAFVQAVGQPVDRFGRFAVSRQERFQRLDVGRRWSRRSARRRRRWHKRCGPCGR